MIPLALLGYLERHDFGLLGSNDNPWVQDILIELISRPYVKSRTSEFREQWSSWVGFVLECLADDYGIIFYMKVNQYPQSTHTFDEMSISI